MPDGLIKTARRRHRHVFSLEPLNNSVCNCGRRFQDYMCWIRAHGKHANARWASK